MAACHRRDGTPKKMYRSREDAVATIRPEDGQVHPYPCTRCGSWHLGHATAQQAAVLGRKLRRKRRRFAY